MVSIQIYLDLIKILKERNFRLITTASADVPLKGLDYTLTAVAKLKK